MSVSVELLLPVLLSVVPVGGLTVAVLTRSPVAEDWAVPVTVKITELATPEGMSTVALEAVARTGRTRSDRGGAGGAGGPAHAGQGRRDGVGDGGAHASLGPLLVTVIV